MARRPENRERNRDLGVGPGRPPVEHQFKPGVSGNPLGRPSKKPITAALDELMPKRVPEAVLRALRLPGVSTKAEVTWAQVVARGIAVAAARGKPEAVREIADRLEGKAPLAPEDRDALEFAGFGSAEARDV